MPPANPPSSHPAFRLAEWTLVAGLLATFAGTTMALGGGMAAVMVWSSAAVFLCAALGLLLWPASGGAGRPRLHRAALLPLPFLIYVLASVLGWAPARWLAWTEWLLWFQAWLVFVLVLHFGFRRAHVRAFVGTLVVLGLVGVMLAAYQRLSDPWWLMLGRTQSRYFHGRSAGMFGIPNSLAALLELMVPLCLALVFSRAVAPAAKVVCGWLAGLFLLALVLTGSRGGWLGCGVALILWPVLAARRPWRRGLSALLVIVVVVGGFWATYHASEYARRRMQPFLAGEFEVTRPRMWEGAVALWQTRPWLGTGAGSYAILLDQHRRAGFNDAPKWAHNDYLNTLSDHGLAGLVLWAGAGLGMAWGGWRAIRRARREATPATPAYHLAKWKLGLWLGLLAFAIHLLVDFHTKIPALAFAAAISLGLLLRDEPGWRMEIPRRLGWGVGGTLALAVIGVGWWIALPLYRAEALRFQAREWIDLHAMTGKGDPAGIVASARRDLARAVRIDPENGQAWADLSYATLLEAWVRKDNIPGLGRFGELAADEALRRCAVAPEFWVRKGVALTAQGEMARAEACYDRAARLAPNVAYVWYYRAHHLARLPERKSDAIAAIQTCLTLDPYYVGGEGLRQQLLTGR